MHYVHLYQLVDGLHYLATTPQSRPHTILESIISLTCSMTYHVSINLTLVVQQREVFPLRGLEWRQTRRNR